jgi:2-polyprenyl-3-methyl-5-hydroxy-6-metoxy-1,4-benzoquinol methylase
MLNAAEQKQAYFNRYWQTRDIESADERSCQRAALVKSLLPAPSGQRLLEIGCGRGTVLRNLLDLGYTVSGCDIASESIAALRRDRLDVFLGDIERDPLPGRYEIILCLEVLQQLFDPPAALQKMMAALNPGGILIVSVPNEFHLASRLHLLTGRSHLGHFNESHLRLFSPPRAKELFTGVGLEIDRVISVPALPPRFRGVQKFAAIMARIWPGLFSLSQIYRLRTK